MKVWWCFRHGAQVIAVTTKFPKPDIPKCCWYRSEAEDDSRDVGPCGDFREMELHPAGTRVVTGEALEGYRRWWCTSPLVPKCKEGRLHPYESPSMHADCQWVFVIPADALAQSKEGAP